MKKVGLILSLCLLSTVVWADNQLFPCYDYYVGIESQLRHIAVRSKKMIGEFDKEAIQPHILGGLKLTESLALEAGMSLFKSKRDLNRLKIRSSYLSLAGFLPVSYNVDLIGSIGFSNLKYTAKQKYVTHKSHGNIPRVMVGLQYMFNNNIGMRTSVIWEKVTSIKSKVATLDNSAIYSIGLLAKF